MLASEEMFTQQQQYFYRSVIVVIQHGQEGTVGLILNRPTTFTMGDVCTGDLMSVPGLEDNVSVRLLGGGCAFVPFVLTLSRQSVECIPQTFCQIAV